MKKRMRIIPLSIQCVALALLCLNAHAGNLPIRKHLVDATAINIERAPKYAELTSNASLKLSYELVFMENLAKIGIFHLDLKSKKYLDKGIGLFHDDLIDMSHTPIFRPYFGKDEAPSERIEIKISSYKKNWLEYIAQNDLQSVYDEAVILLEDGDLKSKNQNCLTRHFVESIARSLMNHEGHREKSIRLGLPDPRNLLLSFLKIQIISLIWAQSLDKRAYPIQAKGIPFFCQDVPEVPYR